MTLDEMILKQKLEARDTIWENIKFEVEYFWKNKILDPIGSFIEGIHNFWIYKSVIWNDRWWDYSFLHTLLRFKLNNMKEHWHKDTHYCNDWNDLILLDRLVEILDEIDEIEDSWTVDHEEKIKKLYDEFGYLLFSNREMFKDVSSDDSKPEYMSYYTNGIQLLWD